MTPTLLLAAALLLAPPEPAPSGPDHLFVREGKAGAELAGRVGGKEIAIPLDAAPTSVRLHPDGASALLGYPGAPSRIARIDLATGRAEPFAAFDGHLARFDVSPAGALVAAAVRGNPDFGTGEIRLVAPGGKGERLVGGADEFAYDCPRFIDEGTLLFNRSRLPDPEVPKFDRVEFCRLALADRTAVPVAGGATVFDEKGEPSGFKASEPSPLPGGAIGFMRTVGHTDKTYARLEAGGGAPRDLTPVEEGMVEPRANGAFIAWLEIEPGESAGKLVCLPAGGGGRRTLAERAICFDIK